MRATQVDDGPNSRGAPPGGERVTRPSDNSSFNIDNDDGETNSFEC